MSAQHVHHMPAPYMTMPGPLPPPPQPPSTQTYAGPTSQAPEDTQPFASPKSQRKTKGHVASACVPCKKAHLRCDARRPCSRCLSNGKEDACIDVQHKKRGRPRLRDDREGRYAPSTYPHPQDAAIRRPLSLYSSGGPVSGYDDPLWRVNSYRILKSQQSEPIAPRYLERASASEANMYPPPLAIPSSAAEPVAFLNLDMEVVKASPTFMDAIGISNIRGRALFDLVTPSERTKVQGHQLVLQEERSRKDPMYLPPIFGKQEEERVFETLRFDAEELARIQMDRRDMLAFAAPGGQLRSFLVRFGSAKRDSTYFIALMLVLPPGDPYATTSPHAREVHYGYPTHQPYHHPQHSNTYSQHSQMTAPFDPNRPRFGEGSSVSRPSTGHPPPQLMPGLSPGLSPGFSPGIGSGMPSYAASPTRPDYAAGPSSSQIPRSELPPSHRPPPQHSSYQLPPIRSSPQQVPQQSKPPPKREDRSGRVDIGGLIDKPEQPRRPQ
ncbi:hypothetical protein VdG2_01489 [Verticillium dahliae VDG2]|nr:hypothetical protein VdG2_01489 [Verticillium dahliae VDG2]